MDAQGHDDQVLDGRRALEAARRDEARAAFEAGLGEHETPDARDAAAHAARGDHAATAS